MSTRYGINLNEALSLPNGVELVEHKKQRKRPAIGDFFAVEVQGYGWLIGRVIMESPSQLPGVSEAPFGETFLIYIYKKLYPAKPSVAPDPAYPELIMPPMVVARDMWSKGFAAPLVNRDIQANEVLPKHCFYERMSHTFFDEKGRVLDKISMPCSDNSVFFVEGLCLWLAKSLRDGFDQDNHPLS